MLKTRKSVVTLGSAIVLLLLLAAVAWGASGGEAQSGGAVSGGSDMAETYTLTAIYPKTPGSSFDMDYYNTMHGPLVQDRFEPLSIQVNEGVSGAEEGSEPAYWVITVITFASLEELQNAVATHGEEVVGDIQNFTDVEVQLQVNRNVN